MLLFNLLDKRRARSWSRCHRASKSTITRMEDGSHLYPEKLIITRSEIYSTDTRKDFESPHASDGRFTALSSFLLSNNPSVIASPLLCCDCDPIFNLAT